MAYSLHEIARILGPQLAEEHLTDAFDIFMQDIDDVKLGSIQHFADFLAQIFPETREQYLPWLSELSDSLHSNSKFQLKWRFRTLISEQLPLFCSLFSPQNTFNVVAPLIFRLIRDDVASVREASFEVDCTKPNFN